MRDMSEEATRVTERHFRYLAERTVREDDFLRSLKEAARGEEIPPIAVSPEQASFMQILLRLRGARDVVEVGTLAGYSAIAMARALPPDGRVRTIEIEPRFADFARRWVARSDVGHKVEILVGAGRDVLARLETASADACFIDADKASYRLYLDECLRILRPGGLVMVDNAFAFGQLFDEQPTDPDTPAIRAFNDHVPRVAGLQSMIVPLGDGMWVGVKV
ncbi:MAG: O-methyltransferase [Planctomycetota bacterium]|jgi:predicted O-methyltransferase YrrM